jgi:hypothetical protein
VCKALFSSKVVSESFQAFIDRGATLGASFPQILSYKTKLASQDAVVPDVHSASTFLIRYQDDLPSEL